MAVGRRGQLLFPSSFFLVKKFFSSGKLRNRAGDDPYRTLPRARNGPSGGGTAAVCRYCACVRVTVPRISGLGVGQLRNAAAHRTSISRRVMPPRPVNEKLFFPPSPPSTLAFIVFEKKSVSVEDSTQRNITQGKMEEREKYFRWFSEILQEFRSFEIKTSNRGIVACPRGRF